MESSNTYSLEAYILDGDLRVYVEKGLMQCNNPREWAWLLIHNLYLNEELPWQVIKSRNFIIATAALCVNLKKPNYETLRKALYRQFKSLVHK